MANQVLRALSNGDPFDPENPTLPPNPTYEDLAMYEEAQRNISGQKYKQQIGNLRTGIESQYDKSLKDYQTTSANRRASLSSSLSDSAKKTFELNNPAILEDLNSRGVFSSGTAVANAEADALKELELQNQGTLRNFDTSSQNYEDQVSAQRLKDLNELDSAGTSAGIQSQQDALDSALNLRKGQLQQSNQTAQAAQEEALARELAGQQQRSQLTNSLIGVGGNLGGLYLGSKLFGGAAAGGGLGGSTAGILGGFTPGLLGGVASPGAGAAGSTLFPGGIGSVGTAGGVQGGGLAGFGGLGGLAAIGGAGIGASMLSKAVQNRVGSNLGTTFGNIAGTIANPIGAQLNKAKDIIKNPAKAISNAFCFEANTPITMDDGSQRPISQLYIGAETKGGVVVSLRTAKAESGTRYLYKGIRTTAKHAVKEDGKWIRIEDSSHSGLMAGSGIVWSIVTDKHRVWINGIEMADEHETDRYEELSLTQSLEALNKEQPKEVLVHGI